MAELPLEMEACTECGEATIVALTEPDGRPVRFNARALKGWRLVRVTPSHAVGMPTDVHEPHSLTCKAVNRT